MSSNYLNRELSFAVALPVGPIAEAASVPILQELRQKTAKHHRALEQTADILGCMNSKPAYWQLLLKFLAIYAPLESRIANVPRLRAWLPDLSQRTKVPLLRSDLLALGISLTHSACVAVPEIQSVASAFGCLYVLEGSTLGGQIITGHVAERLGLGAENGCRFFASYGPRVGEFWKVFGSAIEKFSSAHEVCRNEVVEASISTFNCFSRWLVDAPSAGQN